MIDVRQQAIKTLEELNPSGAEHKGTDATYSEFIFPEDLEPLGTRLEVMKKSSCALKVRSLWRVLGCDHPILAKPYRDQKAPADVEEIARAKKARVLFTGMNGPTPLVGDSFYIDSSDYRRAHFGTIVEVLGSTASTWLFRTIEGGQGRHGANIEEKISTWQKIGSTMWIGDRKLICWYDLEKICSAEA